MANGYNSHLFDDVVIPVGDLKVGDVLVANYSTTSQGNFDPYPHEIDVQSIDCGRVGYSRGHVTPIPKTGKVWIRARKKEDEGVEIGTDDVRVGDVITGWGSPGGTMPRGQQFWTVTKVDRKPNGIVIAFYASKTSAGPGAQGDLFWQQGINAPIKVRVKRESSSQSSSAPAKKVIDPYPDFCTRCGAPAYLGLFEVEHKNEAAAKDCPARRK